MFACFWLLVAYCIRYGLQPFFLDFTKGIKETHLHIIIIWKYTAPPLRKQT